MGLDSVEMVIAIEEQFGISIPDSVASELITPGHVYDHIVQELSEQRHAKVPDLAREVIWNQLVEIVANQLGVEPELVTRASGFTDDLGMD